MENRPLMPKATAAWLIDNTSLTFEQIADFCHMHVLEIKAMADGEVGTSITPLNPLDNGQLTLEDLRKAEQDPKIKLHLSDKASKFVAAQKRKATRYTPIARRQDKPDAVAWFLKYHPEVQDSVIAKLIGTTKKTIEAVRNKTHWNSSNIKPRDPVLLGLCSQTTLDEILSKLASKNK